MNKVGDPLNEIHDLVIIGGGPAGAAAAVYAGRKRLKTLIITESWGGQSLVSPDIHNWIGIKSITGEKLANNLQSHVEEYQSQTFIIILSKVIGIKKEDNFFKITTVENQVFLTRTVLIASGSRRRTLDIPGSKEYEHKGLTYCASCDGLFFADKDVIVIGGGNAAFESALQLSAYCQSVKIIVRSQNIRADELTVEAVKKDPKVTLHFNCEPKEVVGDKTVTGLKIFNKNTNKDEQISCQGIFVEIGQIPNTDFFENLLEKDEYNKIKIDPWTGQTSCRGIWAAGDCTNIRYHQNNIASGEGVKSLENIYQFVKQNYY